MTAREHAERADRLLEPSSSGMAGSLGQPGPSPVDVAKAHAHAQTAIALALTAGPGPEAAYIWTRPG